MAESNATQVILTDDGLKIIKAQDTADNAAGGVANLNDPNLLSVIEKSQLKIQMDNFATIHTADKDIATSEGIDFTAYDAAYHAYLTYMTPLVADMTTYSPIVRATFNSMVTAVQAEQKRFNVATQAQYNQQINKAQNDISDGQTKYKDLLSEARAMESSAAGISDVADRAISTAGFASNAASAASQAASSALASVMSAESNASSAVSTANSTASAFGPVKQNADSALASALNAQNDASSAVIQASSAASDSKDAKQIAGAVSQSYKTLTDGSTMTIAELQNGLAVKLTKTDLNGYATQDWAQNQIKLTADGINGTISSVKSTVDGHTTSINDFQADSKKFKAQFTTYKDTVDRHDKDIGKIQADAKSLSSNFDSLSSDNKTNQHDIGKLQVSAKEFNNTLTTVQTQVQNSAVGTNLLKGTAKCEFSAVGLGGTQTIQKYDDTTNFIQDISDTPTKMGSWWGFTPELGQVYTLSADVCGNGYIPGYWFHYEGGDADSLGRVDLTNDWKRISNTFRVNTTNGNWIIYASNSTLLKIKHIKIEKGSLATDWCPNPEDTATVTAVSKISQTVNGLQTTVSDKVSSSQLTELSGQLTNQIKDLSSKTDSSFEQTASDINGRVKKGDVVNQFNIDAGGALLSTSGNSTKIVFSSPNIIFDSNNPVQIPNANIPGKLTGKTIESSTITATTKITGSDIEAPLVHSPSGSFKLDGNTGDIIGASIHSANNSWRIDKDGNINGVNIEANMFSTNNKTFTADSDGLVTAKRFIIKGVTNLVYNASLLGGNGSTIPGWSLSANGFYWPGVTHDGVPSIGWNNTTGAGVWDLFAQTKLYPLNGATGQPFSASVWFLDYGSDTSLHYSFNLTFFDSNGNRIESSVFGPNWNGIGSSQGWRYVTVDNAVAPSNAAYVGLQYWSYNGHGNACFSSPMLTQTAQSTGYQPDTGNIVNAGIITGSTINAGSINTNANNTSRWYPFTAGSDGVLRSYDVSDYFANYARMYSGSIVISDRNMVSTGGNKYGGETAVINGSSISLSAGYTVGKDTNFDKPLVAEGEPGTTQLILSGINGITLKGDDQKIHFHGMYSDRQPKGITFTPYGNINGDEGSTTGNWYVGYNLANMTAQFGIDNLRKNTIGLYRPTFVDEIGAMGNRLDNGRLLLHAVDGNAQMYLLNDGNPAFVSPTIYNRTYSNGANMFVTSAGRVGRSTSASKYKLAIARSDDTSQADRLMTLNPASWNDKVATEKMAESLSNGEIPVEAEINLKRHYGLIAEDLRDAGLDEFLITGDNGQIEGIEYDRLWTVLIPKIKQLNNRINELERKII
ncbi:phage tail protein [Lactiplantibacillus plantarum]|nr:phage tail protein [Lactiplantibacillus plantarum]